MPDSKAFIRSRTGEILRTMPAMNRAARSGAACGRALVADIFPAGATVLLYAPMVDRGEPDLHLLAEGLVGRGCRIGVPRVDWASRGMTAAEVRNLHSDLEADSEHAGDRGGTREGMRRARVEAPEIPTGELDVVVVPGVAFDRRGGRLGRGAGFYDRFLAGLGATRPVRVAIAFDEQIVEAIPEEPHDQRMHWVMTPTRVIQC